jgi:hypothetical protein
MELTVQSINPKTWTIPVVDAGDGELGFELPDDVMDQLNLSVGDVIIWEETANGWSLRKKDNDG